MANPYTDLHALAVRRAAAPTAMVHAPRRWLTRVILPLLILGGFSGLMVWASWDLLTPRLPITVQQVVARKGIVQATGVELFTATGWIEPRPNPIEVPALSEGVVEKLLVLPGQRVEAGDVIVQLVAADAELGLESAQQEAAELRLKLQTAQLDVEEMEAQLKSSKVAVKSDEELVRNKVVSPLRLEQSRAQQEVAEAKLKQAKARLAESDARFKHCSVHERIARLRLERMTVRSPVAGVVMSLNTLPGRMVGVRNLTGAVPDSVVTLYDPERLQVRVEVPIDKFQLVRPDQPAVVEVDVLPGRRLAGAVLYDTHETDIQRNTVRVKVGLCQIPGKCALGPWLVPATALPQTTMLGVLAGVREMLTPQELLRPGMIAKVRILSPATQTKEPGGEVLRLYVAKRLIVSEENQTRIWIVDQSTNQAVLRSVSLGAVSAGDLVEVTQGLHPSDKVITTSRELLRPGMRVMITRDEIDN
jgi:multidrug efflux pump subunit AcrA (membrane-fusion protein)